LIAAPLCENTDDVRNRLLGVFGFSNHSCDHYGCVQVSVHLMLKVTFSNS